MVLLMLYIVGCWCLGGDCGVVLVNCAEIGYDCCAIL